MIEQRNAPPRLLALRVQGFKSFAERTKVEFGGGISAVVGPNGSGKSNLADALRWALGEQGRALRSRKAEDVIWAGSEKRTAQGMADVTLVLDNADGLLPVDFRSSSSAGACIAVARTNTCSTSSASACAIWSTSSTRRTSPTTRSCSSARAWSTRRSPCGPRSGARCSRRSPVSVATSDAGARPRTSWRSRRRTSPGSTTSWPSCRPQARRLAAQAEQQTTRSSVADELAAALLASSHARWHEAAARLAVATDRRATTEAEAKRAMTDLEAAEATAASLADELSARAESERARRETHETARSILTGLQLRDGRLAADLEAIERDRVRLADERAAAESDAAGQRRAMAAPVPARDVDLEAAVTEADRVLAEALAELATLRSASAGPGRGCGRGPACRGHPGGGGRDRHTSARGRGTASCRGTCGRDDCHRPTGRGPCANGGGSSRSGVRRRRGAQCPSRARDRAPRVGIG